MVLACAIVTSIKSGNNEEEVMSVIVKADDGVALTLVMRGKRETDGGDRR